MESGKKEAIEQILFRSTIEEWNLHKTDSLSVCGVGETKIKGHCVYVCVCLMSPL